MAIACKAGASGRASRRGSFTRRRFLGATVAGGFGAWLLPSGSARGYAANEKLNVALVGVGGRGTWFVETIPAMERVVALCDVDQQKLDETFLRWDAGAKRFAGSEHAWERNRAAEYARLLRDKPAAFHDFRKLLDTLGDGLDAVIIATPDHTHAVVAAAAIRAGKHVFCEKPLTRTVHESRALRELARQHKVATQMGNQGMASGEFRRTVELIWSGALGTVREAHVWNGAGGSGLRQPPAEEQPVPDGFHWDLWLGPAAFRPYHRDWTRRHSWREFGTGQLGNWGTHSAALAFTALKVDALWSEAAAAPLRVEASVPEVLRVNFPRWETVHYDLPARAGLPPIRLTWYNGSGAVKDIFPTMQRLMGPPAAPGEQDRFGFSTHAGSLMVCDEGHVYGTGHSATAVLLPKEKFAGAEDPPRVLPRQGGPEQEWFRACRGETPGLSHFDFSGPLNEFLMLGNVATQVEGPLEYDPRAMRITNNAEADALLRCDYRQGWSL